MTTVLRTSKPIAKKDYPCNACAWILNGGLPDGMKYSDVKKYIFARRDKFKILKGQRYFKQVQIYDGEFVVFRARPEINDICLKYDIYEYQ